MVNKQINVFEEELKQTYRELKDKQKPSYTDFNFIGARFSGKTFNTLDFLVKQFFSKENNIIYIIRQKHDGLEQMKGEIIPKLEELGFKVNKGLNGNYNAKTNTITNDYNRFIFRALNEERMDISKGQGTGLTTWPKADNIIAFFEECSQLDSDLVEVFKQGLRGNKNTNIISFHCSNPWNPAHWFVEKCEKKLPESKQILKDIGYQKLIDKENKSVYIRNNVYTNAFAPESVVKSLEDLKHTKPNMYPIACLGLAGVIGDTVYAHNMSNMNKVPYELINRNRVYQAGLDWGDGTSKNASPTTVHFGAVDNIGIDIIAEKTIWNNGDIIYSTTDQIDKVIEFLKEQYNKYQKPFKVYIDNAAATDFYVQFNNRLHLQGLSMREIEFLPITAQWKLKNKIDKRVHLTNTLIAQGVFRVDKEKCPMLYNSLLNMRWEEDKHPQEGKARKREHSQSHWINSGAEYILGWNINSFYDSMFNLLKQGIQWEEKQ